MIFLAWVTWIAFSAIGGFIIGAVLRDERVLHRWLDVVWLMVVWAIGGAIGTLIGFLAARAIQTNDPPIVLGIVFAFGAAPGAFYTIRVARAATARLNPPAR